ncbi:single Ig IL-1-related receptor isoform X6 [Balaenoptera ricei]|uniref:single Ig IL-1-related receptor isoform X6 n=1 Tax=Balaenoptera ricei TaxID=2746895 RepID=UPI0028BDEDE0|nr:single Ig IL-1-related receptor isoform X6 [Balaenoptera ricei]
MWQPCPRGPGNEANSWAHEGCRECCPTLGCHGVPGADDVQSRLCLVLCGLHAAAGAEAVLRWPELHVNLSCSCLTCSRGWRQPLTRPGALTDWPQGQRLNPAQPLRDQSARPRSPGEPWVAPVSSLPRGGPGQTMAGPCDRAPDFLSPSGNQVLWPALGSVVTLNCTASVVSGPHCPLPSVQWLKDGLLLGNGSHYDLHEDSWVKANWSEVLVSSVLRINLTSTEDFRTFTCSVQNTSSSSFTLGRAGLAGHVAAVLASLLVLLVLLLAALLYVKCRLNVLLWYQDTYGEVEMNDGKLYDAYVSYSDSPEDRKFVNFILKPQLERRRGYKLFLDDRDLLPRAEPSADLLVNLSRCRRLVVVLSDAFLGRAWCSHSFRASGATPHTLRSACCASIATW